MNLLPLLQIATNTVPAATETIPQVATLSVWELALKGGWIMLVLLLLSILAIYLFVAKYIELRKASISDDSFMDRIKDYVQMKRIDSALILCQQKNTPEARMIEKGLRRLDQPAQDIRTAIENVGNIEIGKMEKQMPLLATIAAGAPMIGFLGTVTGMVRAFFDLANSGSGVDISLLSGGIYEALVTTVGGLIVGIITLFAYNFLVAKIDSVANTLESRTMEFIDLSTAHTNSTSTPQ